MARRSAYGNIEWYIDGLNDINQNLLDLSQDAYQGLKSVLRDVLNYQGEYDEILKLLCQVLVYTAFAVVVIVVLYVVYRVLRRIVFGPRKVSV